MFAAVLIVCSLNTASCQVIDTLTIYGTAAECRDGAAQFVALHDDQLKRGFGPYETATWCRTPKGNPA